MGIFNQRSDKKEIMDDLSSSGEVIDQTLKELQKINYWLGGDNVTIRGLKKLLKRVDKLQEVTIADIGCGGGDTLKLVFQWAQKHGLNVKLYGVDANHDIIRYAKANTADMPQIEYICADIFSEEFRQRKFDIIMSTLFCHHFNDKQLVSMLRQLGSQSRLGLLINDLHRHWFAYHSINVLTSVLSRSPMVRHDAGVSVLRAFRKNELSSIIHAAGYKDFSISWKWAFRYEVVVPM
ncbi:methyltransferase domain-containing protein [Cytophagaceae bacterium ABcell3]|nr:methyltransferase domain-containing protein [Cytophagaceae bacterium ABcell3]